MRGERRGSEGTWEEGRKGVGRGMSVRREDGERQKGVREHGKEEERGV